MKENNNANPSIRLQSSNSYKTIFLILNYNLHVLACINRSLLSPLFNLSDLSMAGAVDIEGRSSGHENGFRGSINPKRLYSCK